MTALRPQAVVACRTKAHQLVKRTVKGALGAALVQKYFESAGWRVQSAGIEAAVAHVDQQRPQDLGELTSLPDFLVSKVAGSRRNPTTHPLGQSFYVEVKTLAAWPTAAHHQDFAKYARWGNVLLVWVGPQGLRGAWINPADDPIRLEESQLSPLAHVGTVQFWHCDTPTCQHRLRAHFDQMAAALSALAI